MTALVSLFCFGVVVTLVVFLGMVEAREFRRKERLAARSRAKQSAAGSGESAELRAYPAEGSA